MDFDLCQKLKDKGFPQLTEWEIRRPNAEVMLRAVKCEQAYWKGDFIIIEGGGTKAEGNSFINALGALWLAQN